MPERRPRVVLMDIQMPEMSGVECSSRLKQLLPEAQIIVLTVYEDTETIFKALRAGACGYLLKRSSHQEILNAIREILQGGAPMTSAIARKLVTAFQEPVIHRRHRHRAQRRGSARFWTCWRRASRTRKSAPSSASAPSR